MDDAQLIDSPRERPALTFVQFADNPLDKACRFADRLIRAEVSLCIVWSQGTVKC
jgi:hypothetical protein